MGVEFDSIVACDYVMAIAVLEVLRSSGIAVPGAVSVVGFGDNPQAEAAGLTTVAASITELGACAARQLLSQLNPCPRPEAKGLPHRRGDEPQVSQADIIEEASAPQAWG